MKEFFENYTKSYEGFSKLVKVLLCFLWAIPNNLYRFGKSYLGGNTVGMVLAVVILIFGGWLFLVIDIVTLILQDKIYCLEDLTK